ncbi:hypothetical protein [Agromyces sp. Leaf222]|uniref:hypothetical protein n=1 Tax=Agromyces sp. Leaf222 TaxID=1735688 RepID=UPI0006F41861|nr:hypothetical protein [Agromyces sp. Leaf222]KQM81923.1 hypothetical protein ASE68_00155 [Agromyces sp. Leaf222]
MGNAQSIGERTAARQNAGLRVRRTATRRSRGIRPLAAFSTLIVMGIVATLSLVPATPLSPVMAAGTDSVEPAQTVEVAGGVQAQKVSQESYAAATGAQTLVAGGTNVDWAKLVLIDGDWPVTEENITFMMRWTRQENGADNWWNRNNPLNNGQGSGGGSGLGSYVDLVEAAFYAAQNIKSGRYPAVDAALQRGDSADATAQAIWASPWASSHYGYGTHWSSRPYEVIEAPAEAWGR